MGILFDDRDSSSIIGSAGTLGVTGAIGYYGYKEIQRRRGDFARILDTPSGPAMAKKMVSNTKGLEGIFAKTTDRSINALTFGMAKANNKNLTKEQKILNSMDRKFRQAVSEFATTHGGDGAHVNIETVGSRVTNISVNTPGGSVSLGAYSRKGKIFSPGGRVQRVPKFFSASQTSSILSGESNALNIAGDALDYNMARMDVMNRIYGSKVGYDQAGIAAREAMTQMRAFQHEGLKTGTMSQKVFQNTVMPLLFKDGQFVPSSAYNETVSEYVGRLADDMLEVGSSQRAKSRGYNINPFALLKDEVLGVGGMIDPRAKILGSDILGDNFWDAGGNALRQIQNRNVRFANTRGTKLIDASAKKYKGVTNLYKVQGLNASDEFAARFNKLINAGAFGDVSTVLGDDGFLMSKSMGGKRVMEDASKNIPLSFKGTGSQVTHEMNLIMADAMIQISGKGGYNGRTDMKGAREIANNLIDDTVLRESLYGDFAEAVSAGKMRNIDIHVGKLTRRRSGQVTLGYDPMSSSGVGHNTRISGITSTTEGIRLKAQSVFRFKDSNKFWGTFGKLEGAGFINTKLAASTILYGMQNKGVTDDQLVQALKSKKGGIYTGITGLRDSTFDKNLELLITHTKKTRGNETLAGMEGGVTEYGDLTKGEAGTGTRLSRETYISPDSPQMMHGIGPESVVRVSNTQMRRLQSAGYTEASEFLMKGSAENALFTKNIQSKMLPIIANDMSGNTFGFKIDDLSTDEISEMFGGDIEVARKAALDKANKTMANDLLGRKISANTNFYIDMGDHSSNNYRNIPLALFESKYTGKTHRYDMEVEKDILGLYNRNTRDYLTALKGGKSIAKIESLGRHADMAIGTMAQASYKIDHIHPNAATRVFVGQQALDVTTLKSLEAQYGGVEDMFKKDYGVSFEDLENKAFSAYNTKTIDTKLAHMDDYQAELSKYQQSLGVDDLSSAQLKQFKDANRQKFLRAGMMEVGWRPPSYGAEATTVSRVLDMESIAGKLNKIAGIEGNLDWVRDGDDKMWGNKVIEGMGILDLDKDPWSAVTLADGTINSATMRRWEKYKSPLLDFYANKGGVKDVAFNILTPGQAPNVRANVSQQAISSFYNATMSYSNSINPYMADAFEEGAEFSAKSKGMIMEHYMNTLPERAIGSKSEISQQTLEEVMEIFNTKNSNIEQRRELFKKHLTMSNKKGIDIMTDLSDTEIDKFLKGGNRFAAENPEMVELMTKNVKDRDSAARIHSYLSNISRDQNVLEPGMNAMLKNKASSGFLRDSLIAGGESIQKVAIQMKNNKGLIAAGGALLAGAFLLQSPDSEIRNQEARETSRGRGKSIHSNGINPPTGIVSKAAGGARYALTGELPPGMNPAQVQGAVGGGGSQYVINQSNAVNTRYLEDMHNGNKQNNWNYGG